MLLNEVQKQHKTIDTLSAENASLHEQLESLMHRVEQLEVNRPAGSQ
jgi:hypothetical protein